MKYNLIAKLCSVPLLLSSAFVFTSCFYRNYVIEDYSIFDESSISKFKKNSRQLKWISERSFSLRFKTRSDKGESFVNGTSWIISKDNKKDNVYYLATNLHVAAIVNNSGKSYKSAYLDQDTEKLIVSNEKEPTVVGMDVGIIWDSNLTPGTYLSTQNKDTKLKYIENVNNTYYGGNYNVTPALTLDNDFSVVYSANQTFKNFDILDPSKNRYDSQYILNPTADFAVLKVDFSKFYKQPNDFKYTHQLMRMLTNYNVKPTKFSTTIKQGEQLFVGGFPAETQQRNYSYVPRWVGVQIDSGWIIREGHKNYYPPYKLPPLGYRNYRIKNLSEIDFIGYNKPNIYNDDGSIVNGSLYYSQRNVAVNGVIKGLNLLGGSSGSMVINSKNEVVGIYWGGYEMINSFSGIFDLINVDQSILDTIKINNGGTTINAWNDKYNLYEDFKKIVGITK